MSPEKMWEQYKAAEERKNLVAKYKAAGLGGERYGVSCPKCYLRICPQGWQLACEFPGKYCCCPEQYYEETHNDIGDILEAHGLPDWYSRTLRVQPDMTEATVKKGKKKKKKKKSSEKSENDFSDTEQRSLGPTFSELIQNMKGKL